MNDKENIKLITQPIHSRTEKCRHVYKYTQIEHKKFNYLGNEHESILKL